MARKTKPQSSNPNKIIVIFLVIFILATIGSSVWAMTRMQSKDKDTSNWESKQAELRVLKQEADWYKFQRDELLAAIGEPEFAKKPEAQKAWKENREAFLGKQGGETRFKDEDGAAEFGKYIKTVLEPKLGGYNDGYKEKYNDSLDQLRSALAKSQQDFAAEVQKNTEKQAEVAALQKKYNADRDATIKEYKDGIDKVIKARSDASEALSTQIKQNETLQKGVEEKDAEANAKIAKQQARIAALEDQIRRMESSVKSPNRSTGELHALLLDVSKGKPLWDMPRGKITRIDDSAKKVFIDKGSKDGVKPGLTFAVFAAGSNGRGEGELKATIEVIRVVDAGSSLCKVNTYYDVDGREIAVTEATPARILREGASTLREGDLLFNLFWGSHVAIVGTMEIPGAINKGPAGQMDDLSSFMRQLERMGITVDAFTDLRDGKFVGELTPQTNFLIRGNPAIKLPDGSDDQRVKGINETLVAMRAQAAERGMFIISPVNFAVLSGYRRSGDDGALQTLNGITGQPLFVPGRPSGAPLPEIAPPGEMPKKGQ